MKNPIIYIIPLLALAGCSGGDAPLYKDPAQPAEKRAEDLMSRMTLEQKVAQMCQWVGLEHMKSAEKELTEEELHNNTARGFYPSITTADVEQMTRDGKIGSFLHVLTAEEANYLQRLASQSPLQTPCSSESTPFTATRRSPDAPSTRPVSDKHRRSTPNS